jgi:hypothetical protein
VHILLTDILSCPRCGPQYGLILLADRIEDRRVLEGRFGCANCREQFVVHHGAGDFGSEPVQSRGVASPEAAVRLAALLSLRQGSGYALLTGPASVHAAELASLLEGLEVIAIAEADAGEAPTEEERGVNRLGVRMTLPFMTGRIAGVALTGPYADTLLEEGARVLSPVGRLLLEPPPADAARLEAAGMRVLARDDVALVAVRA